VKKEGEIEPRRARGKFDIVLEFRTQGCFSEGKGEGEIGLNLIEGEIKVQIWARGRIVESTLNAEPIVRGRRRGMEFELNFYDVFVDSWGNRMEGGVREIGVAEFF